FFKPSGSRRGFKPLQGPRMVGAVGSRRSRAGARGRGVGRGNDMARAGGASFRSIAALAITGLAMLSSTASADTLEWALAQAYQNNRPLNAQRASRGAQDEAGPQALSGYRPRVSATASVGSQYQRTLSKAVTPAGPVYDSNHFANTPHTVGVTATQTLF